MGLVNFIPEVSIYIPILLIGLFVFWSLFSGSVIWVTELPSVISFVADELVSISSSTGFTVLPLIFISGIWSPAGDMISTLPSSSSFPVFGSFGLKILTSAVILELPSCGTVAEGDEYSSRTPSLLTRTPTPAFGRILIVP